MIVSLSRFPWCFAFFVVCNGSYTNCTESRRVANATTVFLPLRNLMNDSSDDAQSEELRNMTVYRCNLNATDFEGEDNDTVVKTMVFLPLSIQINASVIEALKEQANNLSVSNISLSDLNNDNDTQQMQMRFRERKRQVRILSIQRDILHRLGIIQQPNITSRLTKEERKRLLQTFDRTMNAIQNLTPPPCDPEEDPC